MFCLGLSAEQKLKSHSATSRGGKHFIKIEVEYTSAMDMAFDVDRLDQLAAEQKATEKRTSRPSRATPKPRKIAQTKTLALPPPEQGQ